VIYLTEAIERLYDGLRPAPPEPQIVIEKELLRWVRELFLVRKITVWARLAERLGDENCALGSAEKIEPYPDLTFGYGGKNGDQVRLWQILEGQKLPVVEWREIAITAEDFSWVQSHIADPGGVAHQPGDNRPESEAPLHARRARGKKPELFNKVKSAMTGDLLSGTRDPRKMLEKQWADAYGASRETCRNALRAIQLEIEHGTLIPTNSDK
jgi:hypothetical protein